MYDQKLGSYLAANHPNKSCYAYSDGQIRLVDWDDKDGPPPTPEQVAAWTPSPVPDAGAAVKAARDAISGATTLSQIKAALLGYLDAQQKPVRQAI